MEHSELVTTVGLGCVPRDGWGQGVYGGTARQMQHPHVYLHGPGGKAGILGPLFGQGSWCPRHTFLMATGTRERTCGQLTLEGTAQGCLVAQEESRAKATGLEMQGAEGGAALQDGGQGLAASIPKGVHAQVQLLQVLGKTQAPRGSDVLAIPGLSTSWHCDCTFPPSD